MKKISGKKSKTYLFFNFLNLGTAVFSILGYMSVVANKNIAEIVKPGNFFIKKKKKINIFKELV